MTFMEFLHHWSPWHLRKQIAERDKVISALNDRISKLERDLNFYRKEEFATAIQPDVVILQAKYKNMTGRYNRLLADVWERVRAIEEQSTLLLRCCQNSVNKTGDIDE